MTWQIGLNNSFAYVINGLLKELTMRETVGMIAIIFDVDGTLVESFDLDSRCYMMAVKEILGDIYIRSDWGDYTHVTDVGIMLEILDDNNLTDTCLVEKVRMRFGQLVKQHLENGGTCDSKSGARQLFKKLQSHNLVKIGIATGGWEHTARLKLQHAGFPIEKEPIVSSDFSMNRMEIMRKCLSQLNGYGVYDKVVYIGDGEWDLASSAELGWQFIGIGERLKGKCHYWIHDFSDNDLFFSMSQIPFFQ